MSRIYQDYKDLLSAFQSHGVKYVVVGGFAVIYHSQPRFTKDLDLFIKSDAANEGLVPEHFAYRLEGAVFASVQSGAWKEVQAPVTHYQFVTGWACMDVLRAASPVLAVVKRQ